MASEFKPPVGAALAKVDPAVHRIQYDEECVLIEGVVAPANQNRFKVSARAKYDVFCFRLEGWRVLGEPLVERE
ncbi:MAG TPA: hypothetical protein VGE52_00500, partial [Pirellulales bacterium]